MDEVKCEALITAAEQGSLSRAARILGYTQPGISRMIHSLEEELGFPLLIRTKKGVELTPNGKTVLPYLEETVRAARLTHETSASILGLLSGTLTIGCYYSVSSMILPPLLKRFGTDYPRVRIILREGTNAELAEALENRTIDFSLAAPTPESLECDHIPILEDELVVWLPPSHPLAGKTAFPLEALTSYPFIITQPGQDTDIDRLLSKYHIHPDFHFATKDAYSTYRMVEAGLGISFNQSLFARGWKGNVVTLPFDPPQVIHLDISIPSLKEASPAAKKFIQYVEEAYRADGADSPIPH
ncbi:LysR family transcriptional regulator [Dialister sp.]|jgi:DNA-binding transcriptional LysR family regulator|uniref:LysR family transcriptional regulator n=1 Tax=Dialister sp. TaxID=1955814 RepID=UPI0025CBB6A2|nr:LysR family transcriptional regulator [Dialister sp.]